MATRFCSPVSAGDEFVCGGACATSSGRTGLALRTSGSLGAAATVLGDVSVVAGCPVLGLETGDALGDTWAVDSACPGASRRTLSINFITENPTTNTSTPKMSGIGEIRWGLVVVGRRRRTTGALIGFSGRFSW